MRTLTARREKGPEITKQTYSFSYRKACHHNKDKRIQRTHPEHLLCVVGSRCSRVLERSPKKLLLYKGVKEGFTGSVTWITKKKLEVLWEDVSGKAKLPLKHGAALAKCRLAAGQPPPEQRLHFPASYAARWGHVTTSGQWNLSRRG